MGRGVGIKSHNSGCGDYCGDGISNNINDELELSHLILSNVLASKPFT